MGKYKIGLVTEIQKQQKINEEQKKIKQRHGIQEDNVIVVEKTNMTKFLIRTVAGIIKLAATICLLLLAAVGLFTLLYPEIREPFTIILNEILQQYFFFFVRGI